MPSEQRALSTGEVRRLGVTPGELRGPRWRAPFYGVRTPAVADPSTTRQRIHDAVGLLPPGGVIGGWAAAFLHGARDLDGRGRSGHEAEAVVLVVPLTCHLMDREGIRFFRCQLPDTDRAEIEGIPVTGRIRTAFDLARWSDPEDAVVALDVMARQAGVPPEAVATYAARSPRLRGVPRVAPATELANPRARSVGESRLRYLWVVEAGLPSPEVNAYVVGADGRVVACVDLLDVESGMAGEYDGQTHRRLADHAADNGREEGLEDLGLVVVRATSIDLRGLRRETMRRVQMAHRRARLTKSGTWGWRPGPAPFLH